MIFKTENVPQISLVFENYLDFTTTKCSFEHFLKFCPGLNGPFSEKRKERVKVFFSAVHN